jgi:uncharacterized protein (DUF1684 family)
MPTLNDLKDPMLKDSLELLDWKRRVFAMYADARADREPERAWERLVAARDRLFREHPQTPLEDDARAGFRGLDYFPYDPQSRVVGAVEPEPGRLEQLPASSRAPIGFYRIGRTVFTLAGAKLTLPLYWLDAYGGGLFVPFADATSGSETYGGGRYLLDTVKGADLGEAGDGIVLDFNYAYNPSCSYSARWSCPLPQADSRLPVAVRAGERHR